MFDESVKVDHHDLIAVYEAFIRDLKEGIILPANYSRELEIRRILEKLLTDCRTKEYLEDHLRLRIHIAQLDQELKSLVHIGEKGFSKSDWWNYSFI
jgi:hypothetical protein